MPRLTEKQWCVLAKTLGREAARVIPKETPGWTDFNTSDPGVTLLELSAFLTENLLYRENPLDERGRKAAHLLHLSACALGAAPAISQSGSLMRVNYMTGMVLGADDFRTEQDYLRQRLMRLNRALHGYGVASGLAVTVESKTGKPAEVVVSPGLAIDRTGQEIEVTLPICVPLAVEEKALLVQLRYGERPCTPVPIPGETETAFSRTQESFDVFLDVSPDPNAVALARLVRARGRWNVDKRFRRKMVRSAGGSKL